jgi:murein DD-endopeptidase MepM/ murein hydrolase activator NlpD
MFHNHDFGKLLVKILSLRNFSVFAVLLITGLSVTQAYKLFHGQKQGVATLEQAVLKASNQESLASNSKIYTEIKRVAPQSTFGIVNIAKDGEEPSSTHLFVAEKNAKGWTAALDSNEIFFKMVKKAPSSLLNSQEKIILGNNESNRSSWFLQKAQAGDNSAFLSLPWSQGQSWNFNGGPHAIVNGNDLAALDFAGGDQRVKAAREGLAYTSCGGSQVVVVHPDGFKTAYYHLQNTRSFNGQSIPRGEYLGDTGMTTGCGGAATGRHVHFSLQRNGVPQSWNGRDMGGWTFYNGNSPYNGTAVKNGQTVVANAIVGRALLYNDGSFGSSSPPPVSGLKSYFVDGNSLNTNNRFARIDGFPKMSSWQRNDSDPDQQFERLAGTTGTLLKHKSTGGCLNAYRRWNGAEMNVWSPCNPNDADQQWTFPDLGNGYFQIKLANTNFCVDMPGRSNGGKVHLWQCTNNANQRFRNP